jgi:methylenetetrahydrofolate dehydrogenase (NADP+)/methenyltetrahydrofolate cyclohydrolase
MKIKEDKLLDGSQVAEKVEAEIKKEVDSLKELGVTPTLGIILAGSDPVSQVYVSYKEKACERVGIKPKVIDLPDDVTEDELIAEVNKLNTNDKVDGILVQRPLPETIEDEESIINAIKPAKDIDGLHPVNAGELFIHGEMDLAPCTPKGIMKILAEYNIEVAGKEAVVIGRSNSVGKPLATMLLQEDATVTVCHSETEDLATHTRQADILAVAVGKPEYITADMVKEGAVVIDIGINSTEDGVVGDVNLEGVIDKVKAITPVPGGVGRMTIATLLQNTLLACEERRSD